ncbi:MAG: metal ABC transporter permease [Candidatus Micrarchaeota archaeon]|nr:metal ABC transporter permease [Candidatus Micrarchaeota archaeon]
MIEILEYEFMKSAFLAGSIVAIACSLIGTFVILRRMAFLTDGIAHFSLAGTATAIVTRSSTFGWALASAIAGAFMIEKIRKAFRLSEDAAIGIILPLGLSAGILILSAAKASSVEISAYLFGSIFAIAKDELALIALFGATAILLTAYLHRHFLAICYDEEGSKAAGMNVDFYNTAFVMIVGMTTALCIKVSGILLTSSLIVMPASAALQLNCGFKKTVLAACTIGILSVWFGILASYYIGVPTGAATTLLSFSMLLASAAAKKSLK